MSSPAVVNSTIYVGSTGSNLSNGDVFALDASTGGLRWSYDAPSPVGSSPAVSNGAVYVSHFGNTALALTDTNGNLKWSYTLANEGFPSPAVTDGVVYVSTWQKPVYALAASNGSLLWSYQTEDYIESSPAVSNGAVYIGSNDGYLYSLNAGNGGLSWRYRIGNSIGFQAGRFASSPTVSDGYVYIGSWDGKVYAVDTSDGSLKWSYPTGGEVRSSPAAANGVIYVGSYDGKMYALDSLTGELRWSYSTGGPIKSSAAIANNVVYVGSTDGTLYGFDASTGALLWLYTTDGAIDSSPAVSGGILVATSRDGKIYAFEAEPPQPSLTAPAFATISPFSLSWGVPVTWTGTSAASYDTQYRQGPSTDWTDLITNTAVLSTTLSAQDGATYSFRTRARTPAGVVGTWSEAVSTTVDLTPPTGSVQSQSWTSPWNPVTVTLSLSASDSTSGVSEMAFSTDGESYSGWQSYASSKDYLAPLGARLIYAKFKDQAGNVSSSVSTTVTMDGLAPTGTLSINGGAMDTISVTVTLVLSATDSLSGVADSSHSNDGSAWGNWEGFTTTKQWAVTEGDGAKYVWTRFRDAAGNVSTPVSKTINLDTTVQGIAGVSIKDGGLFTNQVTVTLSLPTPSPASEMIVSNDGAFAGAAWEPYAAYRPWAITRYGSYVIPRTVYVKYKDVNGVVSGTYQDDIILDINAPTGSISVEGATTAERTFAGTVSLRLSASDDVSGIGGMMVSNSPAFSGASWEALSANKPWTLDSGGKVYVAFKDNAGNASPVYGATASGAISSLPPVVLGTVHPKTGGALSSDQTGMSVVFPPGAVGDKADVTLVPEADSSQASNTGTLKSAGKFLTLTARQGNTSMTSFSRAYTMTVNYTAADIVGINEDSLAIYTWEGTGWVRENGSKLDKTNKLVSAAINHMSSFAVLGESSTSGPTPTPTITPTPTTTPVPTTTPASYRTYLPTTLRGSSGW